MSMDKILVVLALALLAGCEGGREVAAPATAGSDAAMAEETEAVSANTPDVIGTTWQWMSSVTQDGRVLVEGPERYTLLLQADGRAVVRFDCNRGGGSYELEGDSIGFGPLMSTRMACEEGSRDAEFMRELDQVTNWSLENGELFLSMPDDGGTMRFAPVPSPEGSDEQ
jgi:heat shock protein HslJ